MLKPDLDPFLSQNMCSLSKNDKNGYKRCQTMYQQIQRNEYNKFLLFHDNLFIELFRGGRGGGGGGLKLNLGSFRAQNKYILTNKWI